MLDSVYVLNRFPLLEDTIREDGKVKTGMISYAWYVWYRYPKSEPYKPPELHWLDIDKYILKKGGKSHG